MNHHDYKELWKVLFAFHVRSVVLCSICTWSSLDLHVVQHACVGKMYHCEMTPTQTLAVGRSERLLRELADMVTHAPQKQLANGKIYRLPLFIFRTNPLTAPAWQLTYLLAWNFVHHVHEYFTFYFQNYGSHSTTRMRLLFFGEAMTSINAFNKIVLLSQPLLIVVPVHSRYTSRYGASKQLSKAEESRRWLHVEALIKSESKCGAYVTAFLSFWTASDKNDQNYGWSDQLIVIQCAFLHYYQYTVVSCKHHRVPSATRRESDQVVVQHRVGNPHFWQEAIRSLLEVT